MAEVRLSLPTDVTALAPRLRGADQEELDALGLAPTEALERGLTFSDPCYTVAVDGEPAAMFGVVPGPGKVGYVWLLGSESLLDAKGQFLRECRGWVRELLRPYGRLTNIVYRENKLHLRWLQWCGFHFVGEVTRNGHPFLEFVKFNMIQLP